MKYYHGSRNGNLTELTVEKSNDGYVYLTPDYSFAVMYGACPLRFWDFHVVKKKLIIREIAKMVLKPCIKACHFTFIQQTKLASLKKVMCVAEKPLK